MSQEEERPTEKEVEVTETRTREPRGPREPRGRGPRGPRGRGGEVWRTVGGALLIVLGVTLLVERAAGVNLRWVPLAIGIAFLAVWWRERWYGFLVAGGILTGIGLSSIVRVFLEPRWSDGADTIAFGAGFLLIYALDRWRGRSWWGFIVGGIFVVIGTFKLAPAIRDLVDTRFAREALPVLVILLGIALLLRGSISRGLYRFLIAVLAILAIAAASLSTGGIFTGFDIFGGSQRFQTTQRLDISDMGDVLVLESGSSDVRITGGGDEAQAIVTARASSLELARRAAESVELIASRSGNEFTLTTTNSFPPGVRVSIDYAIGFARRSRPQGVPDSRSARVVTSSGDVTVDGSLQALDIRVASGDITLDGEFGTIEIASASGDVEGSFRMTAFSDFRIRTASGDVQFSLEADDPTITIGTSSGSIDVDGFEGSSSPRSFNRGGSVGRIDIRTASGDVEIR